MEECNSIDESVENLDRNSLTSFGSGNTTDSDKVSGYLNHTSLREKVASSPKPLSNNDETITN